MNDDEEEEEIFLHCDHFSQPVGEPAGVRWYDFLFSFSFSRENVLFGELERKEREI